MKKEVLSRKDETEAEKKDEEQTTDETTEDKVIIENEKTSKSYRSLITKMFKRNSVSDKKVVKDKTTTETKEGEKEPTPNTSF